MILNKILEIYQNGDQETSLKIGSFNYIFIYYHIYSRFWSDRDEDLRKDIYKKVTRGLLKINKYKNLRVYK